MNIGEKITILRKTNNMSQENLAIALDVTRQTVSKWELNETKPKTSTISAIASFFNVDVHLLLDDNADITYELHLNNDSCSKEHIHTFKYQIFPTISAGVALMIIYVLMSTVFKMSVSAFYLFKFGAYLILFILLVTLLITCINNFTRK